MSAVVYDFPVAVPDDRELDLLGLFAEGFALPEVARALNCTERAVRTMLREVTDALHARNATQAVAVAARNGWI
jgi:DNA-binding NarL/FixJ family response regulator